jgi:hypothetical protein
MKLLRFFRRRTSDADLSREIAATSKHSALKTSHAAFAPKRRTAAPASSSALHDACTKTCGSKTVSPLQKASSTISATP